MSEVIERIRKAAASNVCCPLCGEEGFDAYGLRAHFVRGWCEVAEAAEEIGPHGGIPTDGAAPDPA